MNTNRVLLRDDLGKRYVNVVVYLTPKEANVYYTRPTVHLESIIKNTASLVSASELLLPCYFLDLTKDYFEESETLTSVISQAKSSIQQIITHRKVEFEWLLDSLQLKNITTAIDYYSEVTKQLSRKEVLANFKKAFEVSLTDLGLVPTT
ncbi:MAG: hypothetical protein M0P09_01590 [Acholeplasmataceae bacterium]|nr:hypothetical protein [Acholeplasmataceae bacterium]